MLVALLTQIYLQTRFGAFNATFLVLAQRDFGWSKADYSYHLTIVALFTTIGALVGATRWASKIDPVAKLAVCALISATALIAALKFHSFPLCSIFIGICDGIIVLTMAVSRTKVQLIAKLFYPEQLSSILASRSIIIKAATLLGTGACLLMENFLSLEVTLNLFVLPIALSFVPIFFGEPKGIPAAAIPQAQKIMK